MPDAELEPNLEQPDGGGEVSTQAIEPADIVAPNFAEEVVFSDLNQPIVAEFAPDGRVFVGLKEGTILVYENLEDTSPSVWANLNARVHDFWDRGLLGLALDPDFTENERVYVAYAYNDPPGSTPPWPDGNCPYTFSEFDDGCVVFGRVSAVAEGGAEQVLVQDWCQQFQSHSMSDIVFDAEGALIVGGGDGASFDDTDYGQFGGTHPDTLTPRNPCGDPPGGVGGSMTIPSAEGGALRSQDRRTTADSLGLSGSVIRINRFTGDPMPTNASAGSGNTKRMIAYGLRNPFRMAIHPVSGELWIGDVGWGTWEEINRHGSPTGPVRNYGWPCEEGASYNPAGYDQLSLCSSLGAQPDPYFSYSHSSEVVAGDGCESNASISGLAFYPGGPYPDAYNNALFFLDYSRNCMWVMPAGSGGLPSVSARSHFATLEDPVHLTVGPGADLFYVDIGDGSFDGSIRRIRYTAGNGWPDAAVTADPGGDGDPYTWTFDATGSTDPDGDALSYSWDFGDDGDGFGDSTSPSPSHVFQNPGTYDVRVRVNDGRGGTDTGQVTVNVDNEPPTIDITAPSSSFTWSVGEQIQVAATVSDDDPVGAADITWQLVIRHCPSACHEHVVDSSKTGASPRFAAPDHEYPAQLVIKGRVEDAFGGVDTDEVEIFPETVQVTLNSAPAGIQLTSGWVSDATPFTMTVIRGSSLQLIAPAGATVGGFPYTWTSWSDGGTRSHRITATTSRTLTATFRKGFADVPPGSTFYGDVEWLVEEGVTAGCATNPPRYCPNNAVTRGQMASFLVRALDLPAATSDRFTDDEASIHEADINALAAAGITGGCGGTRFCPNAAVTRAQMASFLVRAFGLPPITTDRFTDDETSIHEADINALAGAGITGGCAAGRYCPTAAVTRAQMAAFLRRGLE